MDILITDDHPIFREGLKKIIEENPDMKVVDEANDGFEALSKMRSRVYDIIILDISLPEMSGLEVLKQIKEENKNATVLILSMYPEEQYAVRAFKAGASGYVTKQRASKELMTALKKISHGGRYVSNDFAEFLVASLDSGSDVSPHERLSDREFQVLQKIVAGKKTQQIAEEMALSTKTVGTYRIRVLRKMQMNSNAELTRYAIENDLLEG